MKNKSKTGVLFFVLLLALFGSSYYWYFSTYGTEDFFVKVGQPIKKEQTTDQKGVNYTQYEYLQKGYNEQGEQKQLRFNAFRETPIKKEAFLKIGYNKKRNEVIKWEEVKQKEIPKKALEQLNK